MRTASIIGLAIVLAGGNSARTQTPGSKPQDRAQQPTVAAFAAVPQNAPSGARPPHVVLDPQVITLQEEFARAETPEAYGKARAHALALMSQADAAHNELLAFQAAVIAADCTYFATSEERQSQDVVWARAELGDLHEAARRYTDQVKNDWTGSRVWYERYVNLLQASASSLNKGGLHVAYPDIDVLSRQLAADAERTIPVTFSYRAMVNKADNIETGKNLARLSWRYGSRDVARQRFKNAIDEARQEGRIDLWVQLEGERYKDEKSVNPPAVPLQQLREEARLGAQGLRESYTSRAGRIWVNALFDQVYGPMLKDQLWDKDATPAELFRATETLKARTLLDEISMPPVELQESARSAAETLESEVLGFSKDTGHNDTLFLQEIKLLSQLSPFGPVGGSERKRLAALAQLEEIYQKAGAGFSLAAKPAPLDRVQSALQPREAILEYVIPYDPFFSDQYLSIFLITQNRFVRVNLNLDDIIPRNENNTVSISADGRAPVTVTPLNQVVAGLREEIRSSDDKSARNDLSNFYKVLIDPLVARGFRPEDYDRLIIVPHGPLHYLPFGALLDEQDRFLVQRTAITIVPSASIWLVLQGRSTKPMHSFLAFGNPQLKWPDLPSLEAAESEVNRIAEELDISGEGTKHVYVREQATEERLLREGPGSSLLHIATHGEFPDENALDRQGVMLAPGKADDGVVRASTVRKLNLSANRLAVLSVCNGGLYRIGPADEPYGLVPAFLQAGSQNAVGTIWQVEDIYGRLLMTEFYTSLLKAGSAGALRQASIEFIGQGQTISRWAGFISVGPARPFP